MIKLIAKCILSIYRAYILIVNNEQLTVDPAHPLMLPGALHLPSSCLYQCLRSPDKGEVSWNSAGKSRKEVIISSASTVLLCRLAVKLGCGVSTMRHHHHWFDG